MSIFDDWSRMAKENRAKYPPGTRIMLLSMDDPHHPVPPGTRGTVEHVDDAGTIHMKWDNGRSLGICTEVDSIRTLTAAELAEEQAEKEEQQENPTEDNAPDEDEAPVISCLLEYEIYIPQPQADTLLAEAADRSISVEELLTEIIQNYMERNDDIG